MTGSCYPCGLWPSTDERDKGSNWPKRAGHRRRASFAEAGILMYHACGTPRDEIVMDPARVEANRWEPAERANRAHRDRPRACALPTNAMVGIATIAQSWCADWIARPERQYR